MSNLWKSRTPPQPTKWDELEKESDETAVTDTVTRDQKVLSTAEYARMYAESIKALKNAFKKLPEGDHLVWDKDDKHAMDFVVACANIRAQIFGIPRKSRFEIKSMAGNIIPAIATTNAMTAGIVVMLAFQVLKEQYEKCASVFVRLVVNGRNKFIVPELALVPPNPKCYVCADKPQVVLKVDTKNVTVRELRDDVLIKTLHTISPDVVLDGKGTIVISSEEGETDDNNDKKLEALGIVDGCILKVDDFLQNYELTVTVMHIDPAREEASFEIVADPDTLKPKATENSPTVVEEEQPSTSSGQNGSSSAKKARLEIDEDDDDDICIVEEDDDDAPTSSSGTCSASAVGEKRKHVEEPAEPASKKPKVAPEVHEIADDDDDDMDDDVDDDDDDDDDDEVTIVE